MWPAQMNQWIDESMMRFPLTLEPIPGFRVTAVESRRRGPGYRSGELARATGISADALRYYERRGLLPPPARLANGYRLYPPEALERVRVIQGALAIGFSVDELGRILRARSRGSPPCRDVRELAAAKLTELERGLEEMTRFRDALRETLRRWDVRLARTPNGREARLLESIAPRKPTRSSTSPVAALRFQRIGRRRNR